MIFWQFRTSQRSLHNAPIFRLLLKVAVNGTHQCDFLNFCGGLGPQHILSLEIARNMMLTFFFRCFVWLQSHTHELCSKLTSVFFMFWTILAEGAIALSVTLSGGALFASWKLLQFPSSLIVKVILAIFMGASAQQDEALLVVCWVKLCCEWSQFIHKLVVMLIHIGVTSCSWLCCHSLWCFIHKKYHSLVGRSSQAYFLLRNSAMDDSIGGS